jgi:uncharacterized protein (DUF1330 family)
MVGLLPLLELCGAPASMADYAVLGIDRSVCTKAVETLHSNIRKGIEGIMAAYLILDIEVTDPVGFERYKQLAPPALAVYDGKYLARGGRTETLEGDWVPNRLVILEFPDVARAKQWLESPEYREARGLRRQSATTNIVVIDGVA